MTRLRAALALALLGGAGGCALDRGEPLGRLEARLDAHLDRPADRDVGDGFLRLASDWQVRVVRFDVEVDAVVVEGDAHDDGAHAASFDPARPPPGYGACHGGHCHADDGRLVPYEEIEAELATGEDGGDHGAAAPVATMEPGLLDLAAGAQIALDCGTCALDAGHLATVRVVVHRMVIELEVRDGRETPRVPGTFVVRGAIDLGARDGEPAPGDLETPIDAAVDADAPQVVVLDLALAPGVALLDGVDVLALPERDGARDLSAAEEVVRAAFPSLDLAARVTRRDG